MNNHRRRGLVQRRFPGLMGVRFEESLYTIASTKVASYPGERGPPLPRRGLYIYMLVRIYCLRIYRLVSAG